MNKESFFNVGGREIYKVFKDGVGAQGALRILSVVKVVAARLRLLAWKIDCKN